MSEELKPCPWCRSTRLFHVEDWARMDGDYDLTLEYAVSCRRCNAKGPFRLTKSESDEAWNTRVESDEMLEWLVDKINESIAELLPHVKNPNVKNMFEYGNFKSLELVLSLRRDDQS